MIERIQLTNFRKFTKLSVNLAQGNVLVGPNNCGKSSVLDAFRLLEACYRHTKKSSPVLLRIDGEGVYDGYEIPERLLPFKLANASHNYNSEDAVAEFWLSNKARAVIRLHPDRQARFYIDYNQQRLTSSSKFRKAFPIDLVIVPTLAPLEAEESMTTDETVQRNERTRLASRVLRNIWLRRTDEEFNNFRDDIESAWPKITIHKPKVIMGQPSFVEMFYSENRFDREVQWAGFGFQVWLQIQTHLRRGGLNSTLIIDEPDIYLHPDLQRRLLRDVKSRFEQFIMATHAVEIINEADAQDIVSINSEHRTGRRVRTDKDFSLIYQYLGSATNTDLARVARARKVIFVEGDDAKLLRRFAARFGLAALAEPHSVPIIKLGGVTEWRRATHSVWAFRTILDIHVNAYCLFDRDYRSDDEIRTFIEASHERDFECKILDRKEIENYLLVPEALLSAVQQRLRRNRESAVIGSDVMSEWLDKITDELKHLVLSRRFASAIQFAKESGSKVNPTTLMEAESKAFEIAWSSVDRRLELCPGKEVLSRLNTRLQNSYGIALTQAAIVDHISQSVVDVSFLNTLSILNEFCAAPPPTGTQRGS